MAAVGVIAVLAVVGLAVAGRTAAPDRHPTTAAAAARPAEVQRFYADARTSLAPLLAHVGALPVALQRAELQPVPPDLTVAADRWAEDVATARDLVGRLIPPPGPEGLVVRTVYELGTMLYGESARSLARLPRLADGGERVEAARSGRRLHMLADRLFDQAKRLLDLHGDLGLDPLTVLPAEVPDFDKEGLGPDGASARVPEGSGFLNRHPPVIPSARWRDSHLAPLAGAAATLGQITDYAVALAGPRDRLRTWSGELRAATRDLAGPVPQAPVSRQASFLLRLGLLTEAESLDVLASASSPGDPAFEQAERLRLIGDRQWELSRDLFAADGPRLPASLALPETGIDPSVVRRGGMFDGHPPPLRPGDEPDSGVPGGLRVPAPTEVFSGNGL